MNTVTPAAEKAVSARSSSWSASAPTDLSDVKTDQITYSVTSTDDEEDQIQTIEEQHPPKR